MSLLSYLQARFEELGETLGDDEREPPAAVMDAVEADIDEDAGGIRGLVMEFADGIKQWVDDNPETTHAILRKVKPILHLKSKNLVLVSRYDDVREVLAQDDVFHVTYGPKMTELGEGRNFFLGMQDSAAYERDVSSMRIAAARAHVAERIVPFVDGEAAAIVDAAGDRIELVGELARPVATRTVVDYFGTPGPSETEQSDWAHTMFQFLFIDPSNDPDLRAAALRAAAGTRAYLEEAIATRKGNRGSHDDVLERCLAMQDAGVAGMDDVGIRNNLLGLIVGAIPTTAMCAAFALDELLKRPAELSGAQAAATADDDEKLAAYVFEAMRFRPVGPGLVRIAAEDYVLSKGNRRATKIRAGTAVLALTSSAMFDDRDIDEPQEFRIDRPEYHYLHFGFGLHTCFGEHINREQIPRILKPLLKRTNLRRAPGSAGELEMQGPFPSRLMLELGD
jgi:cytochrome P450